MAYLNVTAGNYETLGNRAARLVAPIVTHIKQRRLYRETFNGLSALTDRELDDLGLNRSELHSVSLESARNALR